jgi:hypothetical protein
MDGDHGVHDQRASYGTLAHDGVFADTVFDVTAIRSFLVAKGVVHVPRKVESCSILAMISSEELR